MMPMIPARLQEHNERSGLCSGVCSRNGGTTDEHLTYNINIITFSSRFNHSERSYTHFTTTLKSFHYAIDASIIDGSPFWHVQKYIYCRFPSYKIATTFVSVC